MSIQQRLISTALIFVSLAPYAWAEQALHRSSSITAARYSSLLLGKTSESKAATLVANQAPEEPPPAIHPPDAPAPEPGGPNDWSRPAYGPWAFDAGVAIISDNSTLALFAGEANDADGDDGGVIYNFYASYLLKEFDFEWCERTFRPHWEFRGGLGVVDENGSSPYMNYMIDMMLRWRDFPWNQYVETTVGVGGGFWYSQHVLAVDRQRHDDEDRSHLKFFLPIELTLACPKYPRLQWYVFNHHASGGHIFDDGGFDTWGGGIRFILP